jgi:UDP-N-acetylmuramate dehydrogenase
MARQAYGTSNPKIRERVPISDLTTIGVGGTCDSYLEICHLDEYVRVLENAQMKGIPTMAIGEGSNLLFSDSGFAGRIIRNRICARIHNGLDVEIGGGESLSETILWLNKLGLAGMQRMYGIPGTVAGALVGNAGAYGQEIGDVVTEVDAWNGGVLKTFTRDLLQLGYRHSFFKFNPDWFIVKCRIRLQRSQEDLQSESDAILKKRLVKYPEGLKCPGSFFRNVLLGELSQEAKNRLPDDFIVGNKIPAGKLLEAVGARGVRRRDAQFADYHANLIINRGNASSQDILSLASEYAQRVMDKFRIRLEPEIRIVDDNDWPCLEPMRISK